MICTIYSHQPDFDTIVEIIKDVFPKGKLTLSKQDEFEIAIVVMKGGLFGSDKSFKLAYRQRVSPSYFLPETDDCTLVKNLKGLYGFVSSLPSVNDTVKDLFLQKICTLNCEFSVIPQQGSIPEMKQFIEKVANELDAILFVQPGTIISKSEGQHFLDRDLQLILDGAGNCEISDIKIVINSDYFDQPQSHVTDRQKNRKLKSEQIIEDRKIKVNKNLPCIAGDDTIELRSPQEIAQRVTILAITNLVAFNSISGEEAKEYISHFKLWDFVTPDEKAFLDNPTEEQKAHETWKSEGIWILMWALGKVKQLGFPDELCNLDKIMYGDYPIGNNREPWEFLNAKQTTRSKDEILDAADFYYRLDWACVDARINNKPLEVVNQSVVYERHYALNWLIKYMNQEWDNVSCDT
jgi:hypothetical protein